MMQRTKSSKRYRKLLDASDGGRRAAIRARFQSIVEREIKKSVIVTPYTPPKEVVRTKLLRWRSAERGLSDAGETRWWLQRWSAEDREAFHTYQDVAPIPKHVTGDFTPHEPPKRAMIPLETRVLEAVLPQRIKTVVDPTDAPRRLALGVLRFTDDEKPKPAVPTILTTSESDVPQEPGAFPLYSPPRLVLTPATIPWRTRYEPARLYYYEWEECRAWLEWQRKLEAYDSVKWLHTIARWERAWAQWREAQDRKPRRGRPAVQGPKRRPGRPDMMEVYWQTHPEEAERHRRWHAENETKADIEAALEAALDSILEAANQE